MIAKASRNCWSASMCLASQAMSDAGTQFLQQRRLPWRLSLLTPPEVANLRRDQIVDFLNGHPCDNQRQFCTVSQMSDLFGKPPLIEGGRLSAILEIVGCLST